MQDGSNNDNYIKKKDGLLDAVDVVTPWVWHQSETTTANYSELVSTLRKYVGPDMPLFPGVYIKNSAIGWCPPESVKNLITQTTTMYDAGDNHPSVRALHYFVCRMIPICSQYL